MRYAVTLAIIAGLVTMAGCAKKEAALDEMRDPMSMDAATNAPVMTSTQVTMNAAIPAAPVPSVEVTSPGLVNPLPSGPFKPSAQDIQTALKNAGFYTGTVDGKIGPQTRKAIEEFQKANVLAPDGKVGPKTWAALSKYLAAEAASAPVPATATRTSR